MELIGTKIDNKKQEILNLLEKMISVPLCCECKKRVRIDDNWITLDEDVSLKLAEFDNITHTYCPECSEKVIALMKKLYHGKII